MTVATVAPGLDLKPLADELWREYEWVIEIRGKTSFRVVRINNPLGLVLGNTTHRVIDSEGIVHCVPCIGLLGCVMRWKPRDGAVTVAF